MERCKCGAPRVTSTPGGTFFLCGSELKPDGLHLTPRCLRKTVGHLEARNELMEEFFRGVQSVASNYRNAPSAFTGETLALLAAFEKRL